ncbi:sensor histidine kinase [Kineococcus sp. SYSU DK001]|uniref:sensor histidine kinase n=1 Tax=Kineococcus sp. SYSU DK001 TaxID=3383122 RepID=UPI003D7CBE9E
MRHPKLLAAGLAAGGTLLWWAGAPGGSAWNLLPPVVAAATHLSVTRLPLSSAAVAFAAFTADGLLHPSSGPSPVTTAALANVLYWAHTGATAARRATLETGAVVAVAVAAAVALLQDPGNALGRALTLAAVLGIPLVWARDVQRSADLARMAADRARRDERAATARDLHDVVAGHLSGIALQSEAALVAARRAGSDTTVLSGIRAASVESLHQMRAMIDLMRAAPDEVATTPGDPSADSPAPAEAVDLARAAGLDVHAHLDPPPHLPPPTARTLHRVLTEALTNARKHAAPGPVHVHLTHHDRTVHLRVDSPLRPGTTPGTTPGAPGSAAPARPGHGLDGIRERVHALHGTATATAHPDRWRLDVTLPLPTPTGPTGPTRPTRPTPAVPA